MQWLPEMRQTSRVVHHYITVNGILAPFLGALAMPGPNTFLIRLEQSERGEKSKAY